MPQTSQDLCFGASGNLKDGVKGQGQYCYLREDGVRYTYSEALTKCQSLSGTLPMLQSLEAHTIFQNDDCSALDTQYPGQSKCTGVSNLKNILRRPKLQYFGKLIHI